MLRDACAYVSLVSVPGPNGKRQLCRLFLELKCIRNTSLLNSEADALQDKSLLRTPIRHADCSLQSGQSCQKDNRLGSAPVYWHRILQEDGDGACTQPELCESNPQVLERWYLLLLAYRGMVSVADLRAVGYVCPRLSSRYGDLSPSCGETSRRQTPTSKQDRFKAVQLLTLETCIVCFVALGMADTMSAPTAHLSWP